MCKIGTESGDWVTVEGGGLTGFLFMPFAGRLRCIRGVSVQKHYLCESCERRDMHSFTLNAFCFGIRFIAGLLAKDSPLSRRLPGSSTVGVLCLMFFALFLSVA